MNKEREAGKGDNYRPVDKKKYNENYDRIFKEKSTEEKIKHLTENE